MIRFIFRWGLLLGALVIAVPMFGSASSAVQTPQDRVVSEDPADWTPHVLDGKVNALVQTGNTIIAAGDFSQVQSPGGPVLSRSNIFAFNATTGAISSAFAPVVNNEVTALQVSADGSSVYVGGFFTAVDGQTFRRVARLEVNSGRPVAGFDAGQINSRVKDLRLHNGMLYVSGNFSTVQGVDRPALVTLDADTGTLNSFVDLEFADPRNGGALQVMKIDISPDGSRLVAIGNFSTVAGQTRHQLAVVDLSGPQASLADWHTNFFQPNCASVFDSYMRDLDISPDGVYFVITTTGAYRGSTSPCDVTTRWELFGGGSNLEPTWRNYTGGDTTYAVAVTGAAVYVGGHFRWQNNPFAGDRVGPGAVPREGIAALDPINGLPLSWDPGRAKGVGVFDFLATEQGLWIGSDTDRIAWEYHARLAFMPLAGGSEIPRAFPGALPNDVYLAGSAQPDPNSPILYRVNAGGPALGSLDGGPDWAGDTSGAPSPLHGSGSNAASWSSLPAGMDATVPSSTPIGLFLTERWDPSSAPPLEWNFPIEAGTPLEVRLYFAAQCSCTNDPGERVFNVTLDGSPWLDQYDIVNEVGYQRGTMKSQEIVSDGNVDIDFSHVVENPLVNGIEIVRTDVESPAPGTGPGDQVTRRAYDGNSVGGTQSLPSSIPWSQARGAVMLNGTLFTGWVDGNLYARNFNGSTFGPARPVELYGLTEFSAELQNVTGIFYDNGRLYFTLYGDSNLYYRYFTLESEVVGAQRYRAGGSLPGLDWSTASGMFLSDGDLYVGSRQDGSLRRVGWSDGAATAGTLQTVSGPSVDGNDWSTRAMFLYSGPNAEPPNQQPIAKANVSCIGMDCEFTSGGSSDPDGDIVSYEWSFGDGSSGTGQTVGHTYSSAGTYQATLTVVDDSGSSASDTVNVTVSALNQPPTAAFEISCGQLSCSFDATQSRDPEGGQLDYSWDFGDGATGTGVGVNHTYGSGGSYDVELTVTDQAGASDSLTRSVNVAEQSGEIVAVGESSVNRNSTTFRVAVPGDTAAGDAMLLFFTENRNDTAASSPGPDWVMLGDPIVDNSSKTTAWYKVAEAIDAGRNVTLTTDLRTKAAATLVTYRGTDLAGPVGAWAGIGKDGNDASHTTPTVDNPIPGAWRVSYWGVKSSAVTTLTAPAGESVRSSTTGRGGGRITTLLSDSGTPAGIGTQGGIAAESDGATGTGSLWTIMLKPSTGG